MRFKLFVAIAAISILFVFPSLVGQAGPADNSADQVRIVLLHFNDSHGQTAGIDMDGMKRGGYPRLAGMVRRERQQPGPDGVFLIHAGDEFSRGDRLTQRTAGAANVDLLNHIGVDLMTPGNGEFYIGLVKLTERMNQADFPFLAANVRNRLTGEPIAKPYVIRQVGGVKIAFFGLTFVRAEHPSLIGLEMLDPVETAGELVPLLRKQADVVVAVTHLGMADDIKLAGAVDGIDVIIGGHSHTVLDQGYQTLSPSGKGVLIAQAGEFMKFLGRVELKLKRVDGSWRLVDSSARLMPVDQDTQADELTRQFLDSLNARPARPARGVSRPAESLVPAED